MFSDINFSLGSVATLVRCGGGIFNKYFIANLLENLPVKKNLKSVKILQNYGDDFGVGFFGPPCIDALQLADSGDRLRRWKVVFRVS